MGGDDNGSSRHWSSPLPDDWAQDVTLDVLPLREGSETLGDFHVTWTDLGRECRVRYRPMSDADSRCDERHHWLVCCLPAGHLGRHVGLEAFGPGAMPFMVAPASPTGSLNIEETARDERMNPRLRC